MLDRITQRIFVKGFDAYPRSLVVAYFLFLYAGLVVAIAAATALLMAVIFEVLLDVGGF